MMLTGEQFDALRREWDVIPFVRELSADTITPVSAFAAAAAHDEEAFLFESVERGENLGRYSFVGFAPRRRLTIGRGETDAVSRLREEFVPLRVWNAEGLPPFTGGAVGFFGYGAAGWTEMLPDRKPDPTAIPDAAILFFNNVIVFDHLRQRLFVIVNQFSSDSRDGATLVAEAQERIESCVERLGAARPELAPPASPGRIEFTQSSTPDQFIAMVERAKEEIAAGEIFQIVLSQRWSTPFPSRGALTLYRALRSINPSPYMFLLRTKECTLVGSSPEMLVRVNGRHCEVHPIAGTRKRGTTRDADQRLADELLADPKENAEHLMLVDLGRNDLGRVSERGTVEVTQFRAVERYSYVMHLVSTVESVLAEGQTPVDAFFSTFPAGTVSGAPKIRAMELIDEIEPVRRGVYSGSVAYVGFSGNLDSCIAIRTIVLHGDEASVQAGAGIVHDSVPQLELEETINKSAALRQAIAVAVASIAAGRGNE